eukprot:PhF_6_TR524/c0_g2_i2/m.324
MRRVDTLAPATVTRLAHLGVPLHPGATSNPGTPTTTYERTRVEKFEHVSSSPVLSKHSSANSGGNPTSFHSGDGDPVRSQSVVSVDSSYIPHRESVYSEAGGGGGGAQSFIRGRIGGGREADDLSVMSPTQRGSTDLTFSSSSPKSFLNPPQRIGTMQPQYHKNT